MAGIASRSDAKAVAAFRKSVATAADSSRRTASTS